MATKLPPSYAATRSFTRSFMDKLVKDYMRDGIAVIDHDHYTEWRKRGIPPATHRKMLHQIAKDMGRAFVRCEMYTWYWDKTRHGTLTIPKKEHLEPLVALCHLIVTRTADNKYDDKAGVAQFDNKSNWVFHANGDTAVTALEGVLLACRKNRAIKRALTTPVPRRRRRAAK